MASLAGRSLVSSYKELLKLNNLTPNSGVSASLQTVEDGFAGATALQLSNAGIASTGTLAVTGDLSVNTNKFNVVAASGNTSIAGSLTATGDLAVNTNKFNVTAASGNTEVAGTLAVTGASTLNALGATTGSFSSTLSATGNLAINTNKFTVTAASGNTVAAGTLSAVGDFAINTNKFMVTAASGNVSSAGTLSVTGDLNVNTSKFSVLASTGNTSISGTLTVADTVDFTSTGAMRIPRGTAGQRPAGDTGMLRFNTNTQSFEGHNGVAWGAIGGSGGVGTSQYVRQTFVATAGQTSFTVTGGYTPDSVDVFQNGVKLVNGSGNDVTITSGAAVVLATGAAAGDVIDVIGLASGNFAGPATAKRQNFIATASQTVFTVTGGYTPNQLDVFQNGTKLVTSVDVDVSNGSTFTLTTPAVAGDNLEVVGFTAANTVSGTLQFQAGTAAAPSITTFGDTNTGIFFPAGGDTIAFSEGGTEAMRIDSNGKVLINSRGTQRTSNLTLCKLQVYDSSIGLASNSDYSPQAQLFSAGATTGSAGYFLATRTRGTYEAPTAIQANDFVGNLSFSGYDGATFYANAGISGYADGAVSTGTVPLALQFSTGSASGIGRMVISSAGNVGIGTTTSPVTKLHIYGAGTTSGSYTDGDADAQTLYLQDSQASQGNGGQILFGASQGIFAGIKGSLENGTGPAGALILQTRTTTGNVVERLRVDYKGDVGIGTTGPISPLHVRGSSVFGTINVQSLSANAEASISFYGSADTNVDKWVIGKNVGGASADQFCFYKNGNLAVIDPNGNVGIGTTSPVNKLDVIGSFGRGIMVEKTADFTLAATENWIIVNKPTTACTVTLPAASSWAGREFTIKTIQNLAVNSASSNIVALNSNSISTSILSGTAGSWATLVSSGVYWYKMAGSA